MKTTSNQIIEIMADMFIDCIQFNQEKNIVKKFRPVECSRISRKYKIRRYKPSLIVE